MIVHPDFLEHWKTRLLIELTGDESAVLAVLRLWGHCQSNRRWQFPDMTPAILASVCRWGNRKPACHVAMCKVGFVDKLSPKGFAAHQWGEHNGKILQSWEAGKKGGRPPKAENINETGQSVKPTDNPSVIDRKPDDNPTSPKQRPTQPSGAQVSPAERAAVNGTSQATESPGPDVQRAELSVGGTVMDLVSGMRPAAVNAPTFPQLQLHLDMLFKGAGRYARSYFATMEKQSWCDKDGEPIADWKAHAKQYASKAECNKLKGKSR